MMEKRILSLLSNPIVGVTKIRITSIGEGNQERRERGKV
jgi:hypothetical protein